MEVFPTDDDARALRMGIGLFYVAFSISQHESKQVGYISSSSLAPGT